MKTTLQLLLLFFTSVSFSQITLEHTYENNIVTRINLEISGEKYYYFNETTDEIIIYNSNHTFWRTIPLEIATNTIATTINFISENQINLDTNIEIGYTNQYSNPDPNSVQSESKIINENGTELFKSINTNSLIISEIDGLSNKLIVVNSDSIQSSKVYSLPDFNFETNYSEGLIYRIKLEESGEKYYVFDSGNKRVVFYNSNHTIWKTINTPFPQGNFQGVYLVSEKSINSDSLLELGYTYNNFPNSLLQFEGKIVNENNDVLLTVPDAYTFSLSNLLGFENKLISTTVSRSGFFNYTTKVFQLPSLFLEHSYETTIERVVFENSGEKYYTTIPKNNQIIIYNANHSIWKSIELPMPSGFTASSVIHLSETKINPDSVIEFAYSYYKTETPFNKFESRVINENGTVLLTVPNADSTFSFSQIPDLENKFIALTGIGFSKRSTEVYDLNGNLNQINFKPNKINIFPNPVNYFININSSTSPIKEVAIYNMLGALVKKEMAQNSTKIDVERLPVGIYIVNLTDSNNQKSTHKITISH
jgi:hypothetical protein